MKKMLAGGETLEPRHQLYYGRELYYHQRYPETEAVFGGVPEKSVRMAGK